MRILIIILILFIQAFFSFTFCTEESFGTENIPEAAGSEVTDELGDDINNIQYSFEDFREYVSATLSDEITAPVRHISIIFIIIIIISLMRSAEDIGPVTDLVGIATTAAVLVPVVVSDIVSLSAICSSVQVFMLAAFPVFTVLLFASGNVMTSAKYSEITVTAAYAVVIILNNVIKPLLSVLLGFGISASFSKNSINKLPESIYKLMKWVLIITVTVFSGILSINTVISGSYDAATEKTAKLIASSAVPIIGSALGDGITAVRQSIRIIKSGAGAFSILAIVIMLAPTVIHTLVYQLVCYLGIICCDIFGEHGIGNLLNLLMTIYKIIFAVISCVSIVMFVSAAIMLTVGT